MRPVKSRCNCSCYSFRRFENIMKGRHMNTQKAISRLVLLLIAALSLSVAQQESKTDSLKMMGQGLSIAIKGCTD